ncbi:hypothetical protein SCHPADRAFT_948128 [Schizopora paradoxa]|uniref:Uncharacterized protein n=1 Tax=Schizopora paradoxa TaxID=27342 RepID=A0A0H2R3E5_9AGAM|nr:hypothetical protein SCHPADRAFT_948128 [Schizopora paradoxa]
MRSLLAGSRYVASSPVLLPSTLPFPKPHARAQRTEHQEPNSPAFETYRRRMEDTTTTTKGMGETYTLAPPLSKRCVGAVRIGEGGAMQDDGEDGGRGLGGGSRTRKKLRNDERRESLLASSRYVASSPLLPHSLRMRIENGATIAQVASSRYGVSAYGDDKSGDVRSIEG